MNVRTVSLHLKDSILDDIQLQPTFPIGANSQLGSELRFLSLVEVAKIPLCLTAGPAYNVFTKSEHTEEWFTKSFLASTKVLEESQSSQHEWWQFDSRHSSLGVLAQAAVELKDVDTKSLITEVLFFGVVDHSLNQEIPLTPPPSSPDQVTASISRGRTIRVQALPLSSHFLSHLPSPPSSPQQSTKKQSPQFLPSLKEREFAAQEVERKRKRVSDVFDEADEDRRKAKRKGGNGVAAAASKIEGVTNLVGHKKPKGRLDSQTPNAVKSTEFQGLRSTQDTPKRPSMPGIESTSNFTSNRPLSRSPSFSSEARPSSRRGLVDSQSKRSSLSRITSLSEAATVEDRNKEAISRFVMAGMRLYGLQQRKKPIHSRSHSEIIPAGTVGTLGEEVLKDEEYKLIYHQTYKSTVFAFRKHIATESLYLTPEPLRETVDQLLAIFCSDPIAPF